ncbi:MAG: superoxide dismutase family protein [Flavobacteriaceae bacterium]|jgi:superoxide dismutase, Cu-Zn family|nr:superoxide dismutase family protein [Formosa sp.]MDG1374260.1 superoxide dismutase family protein [Flavobacteriaceae bacterium]MDG2498107.1 superoxide dismutase family protein [Flavobacteriaceae bacterium]
MKNTILALLLVFSALACKKEVKKTETSNTERSNSEQEVIEKKRSLIISLNPKSESNVTGTAKFEETNGIVYMTAVIKGLSEGSHAIHIHDQADCSSLDGKSAGGHWNPTAQPHGKWGAETGYHKGDIGNFMVKNIEGDTTVEFSTDEWCIGCGDDSKDILGKGVIVHQGVDDFKSQPSGAAGSRVSCGGIIE